MMLGSSQFLIVKVMDRLFLLVLISSLACGRAVMEEEWLGWKQRHYKTYSSADEEDSRLSIWKDNYQKIREHNIANHSFTLGLNEFADLTQDEFSMLYLAQARDASEFPRSENVHKPLFSAMLSDDGTTVEDYPSSLDYRKKGHVTSIKNQGQCGSCWAFSAVGALEAQYYKNKGSLVSLSEQQLVDCSTSYGNAGCNGGLMDYAFSYIKDAGGICSENNYPYLGYMWQCKADRCSKVATCNGYVDIKSGSEDELLDALVNVGPVSVAIDASSYEFQFYSSGVYYDKSCNANKLNHGVLAVGYGTDGINYWIIKNSWGTSWGDSGYINMARDQNNMCGIASAASYPK